MTDKRKFSHSSMKTWRRCRYRYYLSYIQDYDSPPSVGLVRGSIGHKGLETFYSNLDKSFEDRVKLALKTASDELWGYDEDFQDEWELIELLLRRYFDWARKNDPFDKIVGMEQRFDLQLGNHTLTGFIDGIVSIKGVNWLLESKFLSKVSTRGLPLDPQVSIYLLAATDLGYNPRGVYYNIIRTTKGGIAESEPVVRLPVFRNYEGLEVIRRELIAQMDEMQEFHNGHQIIYRNQTNDCSWDCGFHNVCLSLNDNGTSQKVLDMLPKKILRKSNEKEIDADE